MTADDVCRVLYNAKYHYHSEKELQHGVAQVLTDHGLIFKPEYLLGPRDRIDFFLLDDSGLGIECKSDDSSGGTSLAAVTRQLMRYSNSPEIKGLVLLTTMSKHKNLPEKLNGKPLYIVHLLLSFL
jgi:hypothetical protein